LFPLDENTWRGKSGLQRAKCQLTTGGREPTASATENIPPFYGKGEKVR
tara:strand:- start:9784 stop:9930 length:147 start_codon:yes stop_codon:yes gene_type:complete